MLLIRNHRLGDDIENIEMGNDIRCEWNIDKGSEKQGNVGCDNVEDEDLLGHGVVV